MMAIRPNISYEFECQAVKATYSKNKRSRNEDTCMDEQYT